MNEMTKMLKSKKPTEVYNTLTLKYDELSGPTSKKQIYDKKYTEKTNASVRRNNLADNIAEIDNLVANGNSIVKSVIRDQG